MNNGLKKMGAVATACSLLLVGGIGVMFLEEALIYFPTQYPTGNWNTEQRGPCPIQDVYFEAEDGIKTHGWFLENPQSDQILVYFHGNAGSIADRYEWGCQLTQTGASVLMAEYRGYGRSDGKPNEDGFYRDAEAIWTWLVQTKGYTPKSILLYGKSLGGGVAAELALRHTPKALILQSTFTSIPDMAKKILPVVPRFLIRTRFDTVQKVPTIACPILVIHSQRDEIVPFAMGKRLAGEARHLTNFLQFADAGHNDLIWSDGPSIVSAIAKLVAPKN